MVKENSEAQKPRYTFGSLKSRDAQLVFKFLEEPNWAPWLAASADTLAGRAEIFPEGQLVVMSLEGIPLASLCINRIDWDGNVTTLPNWDEVAGEPTTFENTYKSNGNTLVMMSMNVNPANQGEGFARMLIDKAEMFAQKLGVDYLIGSFRPNEYGKYKLKHLEEETKFEEYCKMTREDGLPIDSWLRNLTRNGMKPLAVDHKAMTIVLNLEKFNQYKKNDWVQIKNSVWECGEVGSWSLNIEANTATYQESNLWGVVWKKNGLS